MARPTHHHSRADGPVHDERIMELLRRFGPLTIDQVVEITGIGEARIYDRLRKLCREGKVSRTGKRGRLTIYSLTGEGIAV